VWEAFDDKSGLSVNSHHMAAACGVHKLDHISRLPDADKAKQQLEELKRHIDPILRARGLRVLKCYEICCCTSGGKNLSVGGFCSPAGDKRTSLRIALRLRQPHTHVLNDFDHSMRILIHEVSHIIHSNHSASFYGEYQRHAASLRSHVAYSLFSHARPFQKALNPKPHGSRLL
jgi:hypothetical protein